MNKVMSASSVSPSKRHIPWPVKIALLVLCVFVLEWLFYQIAGSFHQQDALSALWEPYRNSYFSGDDRFMVVQDLGNDYSGDSSGAFRFMVSLLIGLPFYGLILVAASYSGLSENIKGPVLKISFVLIMAAGLAVAFFIPKKKTVFDPEKQEIRITSRKLFVIPETETFSFRSVEDVFYEYALAYDLHGRVDHVFLKFFMTCNGKKVILGDRDIYYETAIPEGHEEWSPTRKNEANAKEMLASIRTVIGL